MNDINSDTKSLSEAVTISYNKEHLEKYLEMIQYGDYIDGVVLDSICELLRKLYYYVFDAKLGEIMNPIIAVRHSWSNDDNDDCVAVIAYVVAQFANDVCSTLGENLDKTDLKEIRNELEKIYNEHDLIYSVIEGKIEGRYHFYCSNIPRFYDQCKQTANRREMNTMNLF